MTLRRTYKYSILALLLVALGAGGTLRAQPFSTEIQIAINQIVTGVVPFTALRAAASSYLNWGVTQGTSGYGFRDSAGTIQVKNSGGAWADIVTGATLPTAASFITRVAEAALSNETALGALATGVLINTTTTGVPTIYAGATCTNQFVRSLSASAAATCASVSLTADVTGTLPVARGGTNLATGTSGGVLYFSGATTLASSGVLAANQIVLGGGAGTSPSTLGSSGTTATVLTGNAAGAPTWSQVDLATTVTGILPGANGGTGNGFFAVSGPATSLKTFTFPNASATVLTSATAVTAAQGGTGQTSYTVGDLLYASAGTTLSKLADIATGNALISGGVATAPIWGKIGLSTHVSGTLAVANGGTSFASYTAGDQIYASGATTLTRVSIGAAGTFWRSTGAAPAWSALVLPNAASQGQVPVASAANTITMLAVGTAGQLLRSAGAGATVTWSTTIFPNTATTGDLLYASGANTYANLAVGAAGTVLVGGATPSYSASPSLTAWTATAATCGDTVYTARTTATNDDPTEIFRQCRVATTDATVTAIFTAAVPATTTLQFHCAVTARRTGGVAGTAEDGAAYLLQVAYKNVAGAATEIAAETLTVVGEDQAGWTISVAPSLGNAVISVTGAVDNNVTWHSSCRTYAVSS